MKKQLQKLSSILLCFVMLIGLLPTTVFAASTGAAEESYAISITNKPGTTFVLEHDSTSDVCDLWNEIDSDGTGELKFDQSFSININDAIDVYNNYLDTKYPNGEYDDHKASEDIHNGSTFYVEARIWINNDNDFRFINKAGYMLAPYGLDGEKNDGCGEWYLSSSDDLSEEFFTMSIDSTGKTLNFALDGTVKEIYEALKTENEALGDVTIDSLMFDVWVSCEVEYYNSWGDISYTELHFESLDHSLYDKHIYGSTSEYDTLSAIPITAPITVNVGPAFEECYEPVQTEYNWYYEFIKEGYDNEEDGIWYGYFERAESKESDVLTETAPSGTVFGVAYGTVDSGDKNYITLNDILNDNNKDFINSFIGAKPRELGGNGEMFIGCTVTLTFADGKQYKVGVTKADYMSKLVAPCMHACTVCGYCTVTDEMLPCNFDQMYYEISNVCICEEPSVPEFEVTVESEKQLTIESTDTTVKVVVEKIEVEETPTHSFIVNTTDAVGADNVIALYNINIFNEEGYPYTLNQWGDMGEELTVSVPVSMEEALALQSGEAALYHILADGTAEEVEGVTVAIDGESATMTFTSDSFSPYVVARTATTYTVTVNGGTASPAGPNAEGTEVTITATLPANMGFKQWNGLDGVTFVDDTNKQSATATFKMPAKAVEATAAYGINNVTATATGNIKPVLGNNAETEPTFTYNFTELTTMSNSCWRYSSDGEEWEYAGYTEATKNFCEGYWYFDLNVRLNGLSISDPCTVTVNGTKWQIIRPSVHLSARSPVYYLDAEGNVSVVMFEIDGVTATCPAMPESLSAEDNLPHLTFTPSPQQAVVRGDGTWQKKSGDNWVNANGAVEAGKTYRYKTKMHIDDSVATHTFANDVTLKVNGTSWIVDYTTMQEEGTSSVSVMVYSPEYIATETYTITFAANGGSGTLADVTGVTGEYTLPENGFTAPSGKQFKAWSVGGSEKAVGDKITVTADTTVTAVWESVSEYTKKGDISAVTATAVLPPVLGATTYTSVTITDPTDAAAKGVIIAGTSWYKKDASNPYGWTQCSTADTFGEGTYRLSVQLRSKSNGDKEYYAMSGDTTFTVNGVLWSSEEPFRDYYVTDGYGYRFFVSPEFTLGGKTLDSIAVTTPPTKTAYREGEDFNPAGMVVTATYTDNTTAPVVLYNVTDGTDMAAGKISVTISYTEGGETRTTTQVITVAKEYTVTVTGGTGNGKYIAGEEVTISAFVSAGMQFKEWQGTEGLYFTGGTSKTSATATFTMPAQNVNITAVTGPAEYYAYVTGGSGTGMYEAGKTVTIVADPPEAGKQFKTWVVGDGKVLRFTESDITSSTAKFVMPGEAVRIEATYEDIPAAKTPIDTVTISGLTKPVVGEMPDNGITVSGTGVTVDTDGSYWGRFASPQFSPYYSDGTTTVDSVVFRDGETYMFQLYLNAATGYEFTADSKFYFAGELLPAPDMTDLSKSFAMVNPEDSTQAIVYINMNDIAHVHVPGDWDSNDTHHWHKCTASGCDAGTDVSGLPDYAEHSFVNGLCTCGAHKHNWSADWSVNETHHWHECSANGCTVIDNSGKDGYAVHDFTAGACVCGVENVITSIEISGITAPVAGETPINSASVDKVGAEVDEEYTFWVKYDTSTRRTSDTYADGTFVYNTPFRDGEIYLLQVTIKPKTGYSFTADTKILYGGTELSAPDATNPTASCGAIAPDYSMARALINPNGASAPLTYTVSFAANGGTGTMVDVTGVSGEYTLPANGFTAPDGKQFKAWSVDGNEKAVGDAITVSANTTVTAVWEDIPATIYTVTFNANGGSVTPASAPTNAEGKLTSLPTPTRSGSYSFNGWYTAASGGTKVTSSTVFNANTTIYAQWTYTGGGVGGYYPTTYAITVEDAKNGDVTVSHKSTYKGATVTVTVEPDKGYTLETLTVTDKNGKEIEPTNKGDGKYTFKMPASKVTVKATFMDDNTMLNFFVDVPTDAYYYDAVLWAAKEGITNGTSATTFSPNNPCTRAQMATFLWRAAGSPEPAIAECAFADVDLNGCYGKAILWAVEIGIVNGTSATTFSPNDPCTRAHMSTILFRLEEGKAEGTENMFTDVKPDAYYADAVQWAVKQALTNGMTATTFGPNETCTRAHMVTFLYRYFAK